MALLIKLIYNKTLLQIQILTYNLHILICQSEVGVIFMISNGGISYKLQFT